MTDQNRKLLDQLSTKLRQLNSTANCSRRSCSLFVVFVVLLSSVSLGRALPMHSNSKKLPPLLWSSTNRLFTDLTNSGLNYYLKLDAHMGDRIDLVCPKRQLQSAADQAEYSVIYRVGTKYEFDNCIVNPNDTETVPVLRCDRPHANNPVMFTHYFVKFSPVPNALEYEDDREYYFLSTSSGAKDGMAYLSGGLCSKFNMRFSIKISSQQQQQHQQPAQTPQTNMKENQQQRYNAFNARNNVNLLSHIFTYNRDHAAADNSDVQTRQSAYESHQLDQVKEHERYRVTTKIFFSRMEHDDEQLTTQSTWLSSLNLISSATGLPRSSSKLAILVSLLVLATFSSPI